LNGDRSGVRGNSRAVSDLEGDGSPGGEVNGPSVWGALNLSKVYESGCCGLTSWDDGEEVGRGTTGESDSDRLALDDGSWGLNRGLSDNGGGQGNNSKDLGEHG